MFELNPRKANTTTLLSILSFVPYGKISTGKTQFASNTYQNTEFVKEGRNIRRTLSPVPTPTKTDEYVVAFMKDSPEPVTVSMKITDHSDPDILLEAGADRIKYLVTITPSSGVSPEESRPHADETSINEVKELLNKHVFYKKRVFDFPGGGATVDTQMDIKMSDNIINLTHEFTSPNGNFISKTNEKIFPYMVPVNYFQMPAGSKPLYDDKEKMDFMRTLMKEIGSPPVGLLISKGDLVNLIKAAEQKVAEEKIDRFRDEEILKLAKTPFKGQYGSENRFYNEVEKILIASCERAILEKDLRLELSRLEGEMNEKLSELNDEFDKEQCYKRYTEDMDMCFKHLSGLYYANRLNRYNYLEVSLDQSEYVKQAFIAFMGLAGLDTGKASCVFNPDKAYPTLEYDGQRFPMIKAYKNLNNGYNMFIGKIPGNVEIKQEVGVELRNGDRLFFVGGAISPLGAGFPTEFIEELAHVTIIAKPKKNNMELFREFLTG